MYILLRLELTLFQTFAVFIKGHVIFRCLRLIELRCQVAQIIIDASMTFLILKMQRYAFRRRHLIPCRMHPSHAPAYLSQYD